MRDNVLSVVIGTQRSERRGERGGRYCISPGVYMTVGDGVEFEDVVINVVRQRRKM